MTNGFILAGTNSGCGKTTITMGIMRLFSRMSMRVAAFKTGPDYIDPAFHSLATGSTSHNLDSYLMDESSLNLLFEKYSKDSDIAIVEGVMGMFDGLGSESLGSTAELAKKLRLPVVLVVNCQSLYQSVAAIVNGFIQFDKEIHVAGVILNHVYSDEQFAFLKQYIEANCHTTCLGYLPPDSEIGLESRHLGLIQASETESINEKINRIADLLLQHTDIQKLLLNTIIEKRTTQKNSLSMPDLTGLVIGVARDKAFSFYYQSNLDLLTENGAKIICFSPINDHSIPAEANALYLGGGYPEVFARDLSMNTSMRQSIRQAAENNMPVYAECGGLMYLTEGIQPFDEEYHEMCAVFNCKTEMTLRLQNFGYCHVHWNDVSTKAHEFHHSRLIEKQSGANYNMEFSMSKTETQKSWKGGLRYKNVLAAYSHIHFYSNHLFLEKLLLFLMKKSQA